MPTTSQTAYLNEESVRVVYLFYLRHCNGSKLYLIVVNLFWGIANKYSFNWYAFTKLQR